MSIPNNKNLVYTIIDMIETAENVWSDCCICAVVDKWSREAPPAKTAQR